MQIEKTIAGVMQIPFLQSPFIASRRAYKHVCIHFSFKSFKLYNAYSYYLYTHIVIDTSETCETISLQNGLSVFGFGYVVIIGYAVKPLLLEKLICDKLLKYAEEGIPESYYV